MAKYSYTITDMVIMLEFNFYFSEDFIELKIANFCMKLAPSVNKKWR